MKKENFLYKQIYNDMKDKIYAGVLAEGTCLPAVGTLAETYNVSTITVTNALNALKEDGYLIRVKGKGSFVSIPGSDNRENSESTAHPAEAKKKNQNLIGMVLEHVSSCFGLDLLYAMDLCAEKCGYHLCIRFSYGDREQETKEIDLLREIGVCGMIVMPCHGTYFNTEILKLVIEQFPVVLIDKKMDGIPVSSVRTNNYLAMREMIEYLAEIGKSKIGFVSVLENGTSSIKDRRKGFWDSIEATGLERMPECGLESDGRIEVFSDDYNFSQADAIQAYLKENKELDAIVCAEYGVARCLGMSRDELEQRGITVCCVDEDYLSPGNKHFVHIKQDEKRIAAEAIHLLIQQIEGNQEYQQGDYLVPGILKKSGHSFPKVN